MPKQTFIEGSRGEVGVRPLGSSSWNEVQSILRELRLRPTQALRESIESRAFLLSLSARDFAAVEPRAVELDLAMASRNLPDGSVRVLVVGSTGRLQAFARAIETVGVGVGSRLLDCVTSLASQDVLTLRGRSLPLGARPLIVGILNVTPDSFFDGGRYADREAALDHASRLVEEGADIIEVGGESTRPGAEEVGREEECRRVVPVIERLVERLNVPIAVDTRWGRTARAALEAGASLVNDVSGLEADPSLAEHCAKVDAALVLMHMRGTPRTMRDQTHYGSLLGEIVDALARSIALAQRHGVRRERIIVDPGIGFAKRPEQNLVILKHLRALEVLGRPILVGASRKSFLGHLFGWPLEARLEGSLAAVAAAHAAGASFFRVHDVKETRKLLDTLHAIREAGCGESSISEGTEGVQHFTDRHPSQ